MERVYLAYLRKHLAKKIILISGPRQCGKTTVSKMLTSDFDYLNYDVDEHRFQLKEKSWDRKKKLVIFDELHKLPRWKQWLKGIYDSEGTTPNIAVTGSARLDTFKRVGDSLAGRYFAYRLHPFDVRELKAIGFAATPAEIIDRLMSVGGFPEPFLDGTPEFYHLWKRTHLDVMLRQDMIDSDVVRNIRQIELLVDLLRTRVGGTVSYANLATELQVSDKTVKRWLEVLENLYVVFKITPYSKKIARSVLKQPKYYFYDVARVPDPGARFENIIAASLLKEVQFRSDCLGQDWNLSFLSKKGGGDVDFLITRDEKPKIMVEAKLSDDAPAPGFRLFANELKGAEKIQLVKNLKREKTYPDGVEIREAGQWLATW